MRRRFQRLDQRPILAGRCDHVLRVMLRAALGEGWTTQTSPKAVREDDGLPAGTTPAQACLHREDYLSCRPRYIGQGSILASGFFLPLVQIPA
jgi:hypothetical protein